MSKKTDISTISSVYQIRIQAKNIHHEHELRSISIKKRIEGHSLYTHTSHKLNIETLKKIKKETSIKEIYRSSVPVIL